MDTLYTTLSSLFPIIPILAIKNHPPLPFPHTYTASPAYTLINSCKSDPLSRREAPQVRRVLQGLQPILEPDNAHAQAHRLQALLLRSVREGLPAEGGPAPPPGVPAPLGGGRHRGGPLQAEGRRDGGAQAGGDQQQLGVVKKTMQYVVVV